jgi:hypothetical protein
VWGTFKEDIFTYMGQDKPTTLGPSTDARAIPAHHQPIAVMLDFVNPQWPDGGRATFDG